jgi:hypothetical protein
MERPLPASHSSVCLPSNVSLFQGTDWDVIGVYLAPLQRVCRLPDLIDPTAPTELVSIEPVSGNFSAPAHTEEFDALPPLPSSMHQRA